MGVITTRTRRALAGAVVLSAFAAVPVHAAEPIYQDPSHSFEERAADLVARMTPQEKASQTISSIAPAIPRLGVAKFSWWNEALHGVARYGYEDNQNPEVLKNTTSYPISQSLGASWDAGLMHRVASAIGDEARETAPENRLNLDFYSPTINLARDPRWGRTDEAFSEDPLLTSRLGSQFVNGMEGKDTDGRLLPGAKGYAKTLTTIKHYAANNSEVNRLTGSSDMDDRTLREYYTKAFRDVVRATQPGSVMSSYNRVNGVPSAADPYLNDTLLRQTFGFEGYLTSDCDAVFEITNGHKWQPTNLNRPVNVPERHAYAMSAGEDLECQKGYADRYTNKNQLPSVVDQGIRTLNGTFTENDLDASLTRLFTARMRLGEFDDPQNVPWITEARERVPGGWSSDEANGAKTQTPERLQLAREAGAKSIVLLKNQGSVLPLKPQTGAPRYLVVGQFANPPKAQRYLGGYSADMTAAGQANIVSPYEGIKAAVQAENPDAVVDYQRGFTDAGTAAADARTIDPATIAAAADYDAVIAVGGTDGGTANEDGDRQNLTLPGAQGQLIDQLAKANPNTIAYLETIGPEEVSEFEADVKALVWSSYNGLRKGEALADVLLGDQNPSGRLPSTWYANTGQLPAITNYAIRPAGTTPGRTYQYFGGAPKYPFGFGLSYSAFAFSDAAVDKTAVTPDDTVTATVDVRNTSTTDGRQTVQLYASTPGKPLTTRPAKRLVGFEQVDVAAGETETVSIPVKVSELAFYDQTQRKWVVDPGLNRLQFATDAGDNSGANLDLTVSGTITPKPATVTAKPVMPGDAGRGIQQRVQFPQGVDVLPQLTVAMTDDSLYGYRLRGDSRPLPAGVDVSFSSDDPDVVAAGPGGSLKTTGQGVATVTAEVTANGATRTTRFVVRVVPQLRALEVGGKPLTQTEPGTAFAADETDYDVLVPAGQAAPAVTATAGDPAATVQIQQATSVPGTATVTSTGADGVAFTYRVRFTHPATGDELDGPALDPKWSVVRGDAATAGVRDGAWVVTPETGDLDAATNTAKNLLLQRAGGDWTLQSQLDFSAPPSVNTQQAGLIAYESDDRYLKYGWESSGGVRRLNLTWEDDGGGTPLAQTLATLPTASILGDGTSLWLRLTKTGPRYQAWYSTDGRDFRQLYETGASLRDVQVGAFAYNRAGTTSDLQVAFRYLRIDNGTPATPPTAPPPGPGGPTPGPGPSPTPSPSPSPGPSPSPSPGAVTSPRLSKAALRADRRGRVKVKLRCGASTAGRCRGTLQLRRGGRTIATRTLSVRADRTVTVTLRLDRRARRALAGRGARAVQLRLRTRGRDGRVRTRTVRTTLSVPRS